MKQGLITAVQRFSLNDGPGIRTTIFLKGCSLHCAWCHNPETIRMENELMVHPEKCIGCGHCVDVCPSGAHRRSAGELLFDRRRCIRCGKCAEVCFPGAMEMAGQWRSVDDIMEEVLQDQAYYTDSGGGVTLSGGEVFCQAEFANLLIDACRKEKLHTAVETNLFADFDRISPILEKLDLILFDLKLFDSGLHRKWTGVGNEQIKENIARLDTLNIPLVARTPLIPGVTDSEENIEGIAGLLANLKNLQYYELLNFNPLGDPKYHALGLENPFKNAQTLPAEQVEKLRSIAEKHSIRGKAG